MATELAMYAAEAWKLMARVPNILDSLTGCEAMSPGIALDYVQNVTGDRDDAVTAIVHAGADWLDAQTVPGGTGEINAGCFPDSDLVRACLRCESLGMAATFVSHIRERCHAVRGFPCNDNRREWLPAEMWNQWANKAVAVIDHCRAVVAAAYPVEA